MAIRPSQMDNCEFDMSLFDDDQAVIDLEMALIDDQIRANNLVRHGKFM